MSATVGTGVLLALAAGAAAGNCMLPLKFTRRWEWENIWLVFVLLALALVPWLLALLLVRNLGAIYSSLPRSQFVLPFLFGAGWGIGHLLYGISIVRLGLALGSAIIFGLIAVLGIMVPLVAQHAAVLGSRKGAMVITGVLLTASGIAICGWAGRLRERSKDKSLVPVDRSSYRKSLLIAVACGLLSPMFNYSFAFGQEIASAAISHGNSPPRAAYAVWPIALAGGFVPNFIYCLYLLYRKGSWRAFLSPYPDLLLSGAMTALWAGSFALYGMSAAYLGGLGTSAGWGVTQIFAILTANASGLIAGEWAAAPRRAHWILWGGLCLLVIALGIVAAANAA